MNVPEVWYKAQRALRTAVQVLLSLLAVWAVIAAVAPQVLTELATILPGPWIVWLTGAVAFVTAIATALSRIMSIPAINSWLTKWLNLGSVPKKAIINVHDIHDGELIDTTTVAPDPKVVLPTDTRSTYQDRNSLEW